jgi:putative transposase
MGHTCTKLIYHCVFGTKSRKRVITDELRARLFPYLNGILKRLGGELIVGGGTQDHIHLLIGLRPDTSVAEAMRVVKANSSEWIHETFADQAGFAWQTGYGAFTTSFSAVGEVIRYIESQERHHQRQSFEAECRVLLERHQVTYDKRWLDG